MGSSKNAMALFLKQVIKSIIPPPSQICIRIHSIYNNSLKMSCEELCFVRLNKKANPPIYGSSGAAGADLCSAENCVIPAKGKQLVSTGLQIALPKGCYGRVAPRSGLAVKKFIDVGAGVIDEDYRGEVKVLLFNFGDEDFKVNCGDRIAQLVCERFTRPKLVEMTNLSQTERGSGGFGSTGLNGNIDNGTK